MLVERSLGDGWVLTAVEGPVPAEVRDRTVPAAVPGVVHTDLLAAGLIPDPYLDYNEARLAWIGRTTWRYATSFAWDPDADAADTTHELVFQGLDTLATVELNRTVVGSTANQHRSHRFDVTALLRPGANDLSVTFASALDHAERAAAQAPRPHVNHHPYNAIRKSACNFGWDWGPDLVTAGIWRPVSLQSWRGTRIGSVRPLVTEAAEAAGTVTFEIGLRRQRGTGPQPVTVTARVGDAVVAFAVPADRGRATVPVTVEWPDLWWPRGHGRQPLYDAEVTLSDAAGTLDTWTGRIGFRTVEVDTAEDDFGGSPFVVRVNGREVFVRGANWIPDDAFPSRVDGDRYGRRITDATEAGVNLLRVWGGGIYESEDFYRLCDERGVLVWQDFLFACAAYAEERLREEVEAEAREAVVRLSAHPSLVLWNGANENLWGHVDWGWQEELGGASWGEGFYYELLPRIVAELDPTRPYIPGSPYSPSRDAHPNDPSTGLVHIWDVWNEKDYRAYGDYTPRFVAEFGFQGPPNWSTMTAAIHDTPLTPRSPVMLVHQKAEDGNGKLERGWQGHFPDPGPGDLTAWHWTTQLNQARAIVFGIERFRALAPYCRGTIVWQLNDCWPVVSWAAVDGYGRRKPLWYALRRAYADRLVTVQQRAGGPVLAVVNDSAEPWRAALRVRRAGFDGETHAAQLVAVRLEARATCAVPLHRAIAEPADPRAELLVVDEPDAAAADVRAHHFFAEDMELALPAGDFTGSLTAVEGGYEVLIEAHSLLRDLTLHADRLDPEAVVDEQLVTLLPGERTRFRITTNAALDAAEVAAYPVLTTANDLVTRGRTSRTSRTIRDHLHREA